MFLIGALGERPVAGALVGVGVVAGTAGAAPPGAVGVVGGVVGGRAPAEGEQGHGQADDDGAHEVSVRGQLRWGQKVADRAAALAAGGRAGPR